MNIEYVSVVFVKNKLYNLVKEYKQKMDPSPDIIKLTLILSKSFIASVEDLDEFILSPQYKLIDYSTDTFSHQLTYKFCKNVPQEKKYFDLINNILTNGSERKNRTGMNTITKFGANVMEFDISDGKFPIITTKQISFKTIVEELLWFCRGETNSKILEERGVNIWKGNTSRAFLDSRGLTDYPEGELGPSYGYLWRNFDGQYDQLENVITLLKTDPTSRRIMLVAWNPMNLDKMALPPCHIVVQFDVEKDMQNQQWLSCQFYMRSSDSLAFTYNVCSYIILTNILAMKCGMKPKKIIYMSGNAHIYINHIAAIKEQMSRIMMPEPKLQLNPSIKYKDWKDITYADFELIGYFPHPGIKMEMAI